MVRVELSQIEGMADSSVLGVRIAELCAEVRELAARPEYLVIRRQLLETVVILDQVIDQLARPRPNKVH